MSAAVASRPVSGGPRGQRSRSVRIRDVLRYSPVMTVAGSMYADTARVGMRTPAEKIASAVQPTGQPAHGGAPFAQFMPGTGMRQIRVAQVPTRATPCRLCAWRGDRAVATITP